jgi:hypothetical protein
VGLLCRRGTYERVYVLLYAHCKSRVRTDNESPPFGGLS